MERKDALILTINNEEILFKFGMEANRIFTQHLVENVVRLTKGEWELIDVATLLYAGYMNGCSITDQKPVYHKGYFYNYVEDHSFEPTAEADFTLISETYFKSKAAQRMLTNLNSAADIHQENISTTEKMKINVKRSRVKD